MKIRFLLILLIPTFSLNAFAGKFVLLNEQDIQAVKASIADGSASDSVKKEYKSLLKSADKLLDAPNYTVVDKTIIPPGATANDFVSISSEYWPNDSNPTGFPWVKKPGETNPDTKTDKVDRGRVNDMARAVYTLSQAYYLSDNQQYAVKASTMIKVWFLANKTRMIPHLQYAQTIPGDDKRSSSGVMDGRLIPYHILDSINLIRNSGQWSERFDSVMNQWFTQYLKFLTGSKMGQNAATKTDRNGSWYYFQTMALAWYLDDSKTLKRQLKSAKGILKGQFDANGALVKELGRSSSFADSCFSLEGLTAAAVVAEKAGKKFWSLPSEKKSSIAKGVNYLVPAALNGSWADSDEEIKVARCVVAFDRYAKYSNSAEVASSVDSLIAEINSKAKRSSDERRVFRQYTLLKQQ